MLRLCVIPMLSACVASALRCETPDISSVPPDLEVPVTSECEPSAGTRVRATLNEWVDSDVHHMLFLPTDWEPDGQYPVIVEYPGNGPFSNSYGDASSGLVEDCVLGYGMSGGEGFIWLTLPFVDSENGTNATSWWGDVDATVAYCRAAVADACERYGGDPGKVFLTGFSRGAIACGYIGLHDDEIAGLWCGFVPFSHYDGVRDWDYPDADQPTAIERLERLAGRPSFVCNEQSVEPTQAYIESTGVEAAFTFVTIPFRNHRADWVLRDIPERELLRDWLADVLAEL